MKKLLVAFSLLVASVVAVAAPSISGVSGAVAHGGTITITGAAMGSKSTPAPVIFDDGSAASMAAAGWSDCWPNNSTATYNCLHRATQRGVNPPHSRNDVYIAGAHNPGTASNAGWNVIPYKSFTFSGTPIYVRAMYWKRMDPAWVFSGVTNGTGNDDNNLKEFDYSYGSSPYTVNSPTQNNWYCSYWSGPDNTSESTIWACNDDSSFVTLSNPDENGHNAVFWNGNYINPMSAWSKIEVELRISTSNDGYIKMWENNSLKIDYLGRTDNYGPGTTRAFGIGGFARESDHPENWRYFDDVYLDIGAEARARAVIANNATYASATNVEPLIPSAWSSTSITATVNLGTFGDSGTAWLFVFDENGVANATGFAVTLSGGDPPAIRLQLRVTELDGAWSQHVDMMANDAEWQAPIAAVAGR